jgi:ATP-binding cassette, subfamily B, bacterial CvaB/MchF/RaxB
MTVLNPLLFGTARWRSTPVLLQTEAAECGLACIAMIAGHHGHRLDLPTLRRRFDVSLKGMTLADMVRLAGSVGLGTRALRVEPPQLRRLRLPAVLHWNHNHFVVLTRVGKRSLVINDPAMGRRTIPLAEVDKRFTGIALEAWPVESFERRTERARIRIWHMVKHTVGFPRIATQVLLMSLFLEAITIAIPIGFQIVLDDVTVANDYDLLTLVVIGLGLLLGFHVLVDFVRSWSIMEAGASLTVQWKMSLFSHLLRLPLGFFERRHVGDLVSRFTSIDTIQQTMSTVSISGLLDGVMAVALVGMMWLYDPWLALIAVGSTAIYTLMRSVGYRLYRRANEAAIVYAAQENSHFVESLRGMPSIKALVIGDRRQGRWNNYLVDRVSAQLHVQKIDLIFRTANTFLFGLDRIVIIWLGARAIMGGTLSVGMLVAFLAYKDQFSQRVGQFMDTIVKLGLLSVHGERIADIALTEPEPPSRARWIGTNVRSGRPALSARDISFRYGDNERVILAGFSLEVAEGECVAIAGPSGAGKTTLLKILAGLLVPLSGEVRLDDVPLRAIGLEAYREQIGCVLQDDRLFAGSIAENIAGFSTTPDAARIQEAARMAAIHEEILRMPMGYETLVGDMGSSLSGGQMQRVVLARALYRQPRILLLDEATSHLDEDNERAINAAIRSLTIARVIVAHRRSTLDMADRVVPIWPGTVDAKLVRDRVGEAATAVVRA